MVDAKIWSTKTNETSHNFTLSTKKKFYNFFLLFIDFSYEIQENSGFVVSELVSKIKLKKIYVECLNLVSRKCK